MSALACDVNIDVISRFVNISIVVVRWHEASGPTVFPLQARPPEADRCAGVFSGGHLPGSMQNIHPSRSNWKLHTCILL